MNWSTKGQIVALSKQSTVAHGTWDVLYESIFKGTGLLGLILILPLDDWIYYSTPKWHVEKQPDPNSCQSTKTVPSRSLMYIKILLLVSTACWRLIQSGFKDLMRLLVYLQLSAQLHSLS